MKQFLLSLFCALALAGCITNPRVSTEALALGPLVESHDEFVESDQFLGAAARTQALYESHLLLELVASSMQLPREEFAEVLRPVVDRYDGYLLAGWQSLTPFEHRYLTRTSDLARMVAGLPVTTWPVRSAQL